MKKKIITFVLLITCALAFKAGAQVNLVLNPSFEKYDTCPFYFNQIELSYFWTPVDTTGNPYGYGASPLGSPEYINTCEHDSFSEFASAPLNGAFYHYPHTGNGMAQNEMYFDESFEHPYRRDYTQGRLSVPLSESVSYCVTFYVALEGASGYAINHIGAYLDDGSIDIGKDTSCCPTIGSFAGYGIDTNSAQPQLGIIPQILDTAILLDTLGWATYDSAVYEHRWMKIQGSFVANGHEKFITIGNFFDAAHTDTIRVASGWPVGRGHSQWTWYLIDDVSVVRSDAVADAGLDDTIAAPGDTAWIGNDTAAVGGGDGMPCWWYKLPHDGGSPSLIDSGGRIMVHPDSTTTYVMKMELCGNVTYDTVTVWIRGMGVAGSLWGGAMGISPNPAKNELYVTGIPPNIQYIILNPVGQTMLKGKSQPNQPIDISCLSPGIYFAALTDEWGNRKTMKFIKM